MNAAAPRAIVVGAGPAGLHAAGRLAAAGIRVAVYDRMASPARKFLLAGRGGLNLTHSEPRAAFLSRYGEAAGWLTEPLDGFPPSRLRALAAGFGEETFVGSSGRVFPRSFKASPLLRAWLARLRADEVTFHFRERLAGIAPDGALTLEGQTGRTMVHAEAMLLALGGASWPRMGSDGGWVPLLEARGVGVRPLVPANMGVEIGWSAAFAERFAGLPLKRIAARCESQAGVGEAIITAEGLEGGVVYALSAALRDEAATHSSARLWVDLKPDVPESTLASRLAAARPKDSVSSVLKKKLGLTPQAVGLLRESAPILPRDPAALAALVKAVPLEVRGVRPLERAISSAGGIHRDAVTEDFELKALPGLFVAGEMLDWEAPTGGYLLQATFATAEAAARGMADRLGISLPALPVVGW
jgi:uncharacterized flavoprotein (TIGR03862 family)